MFRYKHVVLQADIYKLTFLLYCDDKVLGFLEYLVTIGENNDKKDDLKKAIHVI